MKICEFMKLEQPEKYDISAEFANEKYKENSPVERYIIYKTCTLSNSWISDYNFGKDFRNFLRKEYFEIKQRRLVNWIIDPDEGSELLFEIYHKLWPFMFEENGKSCSDALTSVQYTMAYLFETYIEDKQAKSERVEKNRDCSIRYMIDYLAKRHKSEIIDEIVVMAAKEFEKIKNIDLFLSAWHTLGNYCPVPRGFNVPRSYFGKYDFWDLSLMIIRKWYLSDDSIVKDKIIMEDLFHCDKKNANPLKCKAWLERFGKGEKGWESFVNTFLFQDWVYDKKDAKHDFYEVIPLWESHGLDNALVPSTKEEFEVFFKNYHYRITERGKRIIDKLDTRPAMKSQV